MEVRGRRHAGAAATVAAGVFALALAGSGCTVTNFSGTIGEGPLVSEQRTVGAFSGVESGGGVHVTVRVGSPQLVTVRAQENILPIIETSVSGGTLHIGGRSSYSTSRGVEVNIVTPSLEAIELSGGAVGTVTAVATERFTATVSGGAELRATGAVTSVSLEASGGGRAYLGGLTATTAQVDVSGGAHGEVLASDRVSGSASGGGSLSVRGGAQVDVDVSGGASVSS
jgi:hypothetical protein